MSRTKRYLPFLGLGLVALYILAASDIDDSRTLTHRYLTPISDVKEIYPSMFGPQNVDTEILLADRGPAELLWVTGYSAKMVGPDGREPRSQEFMCHNTLSFRSSAKKHSAILGSGSYNDRRLFTLSQGQDTLTFPAGFGIPMSSGERMMLQSQVMNLRPDRIGAQVRHSVLTSFLRESELTSPMQALALVHFGITLEVSDPQAAENSEAMEEHPGCAPDAGGNPIHAWGGKKYTSHWMVKPGKEVRKTVLGRPFPYDTTVHYIAVHLHSYAENLELRDLTTNESVFLAKATPTADGGGLAHVDHYSGAEGFPVYADHKYQLISHYNNTSEQDSTAMAFMFCYIKDKEFKVPDPLQLKVPSDEYCEVPQPPSAAKQRKPVQRPR